MKPILPARPEECISRPTFSPLPIRAQAPPVLISAAHAMFAAVREELAHGREPGPVEMGTLLAEQG